MCVGCRLTGGPQQQPTTTIPPSTTSSTLLQKKVEKPQEYGSNCNGKLSNLATNENNVLDEFFRTGVYRVRPPAEVHHTSSPSMDISKASNFERFIFDLLQRDAVTVRQLWQQVNAGKGLLIAHLRHAVSAGTCK